MFAQQFEMDAKRMFARQAVLAGVIADARIDDDGITDLDLIVGDAAQITDRIDDSGCIGAEHPGRRSHRQAGHAGEDEEVQMIEGGSADADADLAALGLGLGEIGAVLDSLEPAVRRNGESSHRFMRALYSDGSSKPEDIDFDLHPLRIALNAPHKSSAPRRVDR